MCKNSLVLIIQENKKDYLNIISLYTTQIPAPKAGQKDEELNFKGTEEFAFDKFPSSTQGWV